ncbi:hypothetical protein BHS09_08985 [Myxococcus xanthus]|uniref:Integrase catalytic domain-containing protein n=1 Tax=Myxococcus xanthus TaxID=34 RepID=A0AAE6FXC3_MYXXA|nr:DDE-type integrase/transposase/recombinase [Myxococcus xanthus]QDE67123.1 hypothetical protein BHS09_08985 [Myxococcus xanthus]QDE74398.1 hypothetical protein BHS08_08995 [Myxococcus xanthus]
MQLPGAAPIEWLTDNGTAYTAHETCEFGASQGLLIRTTPAYSPGSSGMAESFVKSFKRGYVHLAHLDSAEVVLKQFPPLVQRLQLRAPRTWG